MITDLLKLIARKHSKDFSFKISNSKDEWDKIVYQEAWKQYTHEDLMMEGRNSRYLTIITALFSLIGVVATVITSIVDKIIKDISIFLIVVIFALIFLVIIIILIRNILNLWDKINKAGEFYLQMRLTIIENIEKKYCPDFNIGIFEKKELNKFKSNNDFCEGFKTTARTIRTFKILCRAIEIILTLAIITVIGYAIYFFFKK